MNSATKFLWNLHPHMPKSEQSNSVFLLKCNLPPGGTAWPDIKNWRTCINYTFPTITVPKQIQLCDTDSMEHWSIHVQVWTVKFCIFAKMQSYTRGHPASQLTLWQRCDNIPFTLWQRRTVTLQQRRKVDSTGRCDNVIIYVDST